MFEQGNRTLSHHKPQLVVNLQICDTSPYKSQSRRWRRRQRRHSVNYYNLVNPSSRALIWFPTWFRFPPRAPPSPWTATVRYKPLFCSFTSINQTTSQSALDRATSSTYRALCVLNTPKVDFIVFNFHNHFKNVSFSTLSTPFASISSTSQQHHSDVCLSCGPGKTTTDSYNNNNDSKSGATTAAPF